MRGIGELEVTSPRKRGRPLRLSTTMFFLPGPLLFAFLLDRTLLVTPFLPIPPHERLLPWLGVLRSGGCAGLLDINRDWTNPCYGILLHWSWQLMVDTNLAFLVLPADVNKHHACPFLKPNKRQLKQVVWRLLFSISTLLLFLLFDL